MMAVDTNLFKEPILTFGVLADVQYADCDDRPPPCTAGKTRFYRSALNHVDKAFNHWKAPESKAQFVLQLGDIIDGLNRTHGGSHSGLSRTLSHFEKHASIPTFHTVGNHELYNFDRTELATLFYKSVKKLDMPPEMFCPKMPSEENSSVSTPVLYYKFSPVHSVKCISLDCFDVSVLGYDEAHLNYQEASQVLTSWHGHSVFEDWDCEGSLQGLDIRFQQMNGGLGKEQMRWLDVELKESDELGQKVIVYGHVSLHPDSADWSSLLWNYDEVIEIFHRHKCVIAYFSGHTHESGYAVDSHGISYVVFTGIVETPPDTSAFATVSLYEDQLVINGNGLERSYDIPIRSKDGTTNGSDVDNEVEQSPAQVKVEV